MPVSHEGSRVLGAPIGSGDFKRKFAEDRVAEIISDLEVLRFMPSLQMQNGLANGAVIHRVSHLLRIIYGGDRSVYGDAARTYDDAILAVPRRLAGIIELPLQAQLLTSLPQNLGGMGYRTWHATADCAELAAYVHVSHLIVGLFPAFTAVFPDVLDLNDHDAAVAASGPALGAHRALV